MLGTMLNVNVDVVQLNIAKKIAEIKSKLNWFESNSATLDMLVVLFQEIIEDHISLCEFLKTIFDCPPHIKHLTILKMLGFSGKINDLSGLGEYNQQELEALKCMKGSLAAKDEGEDEDGIKFLKIDPFYLQLVFLRRLLTNDEMDGNFSCEKSEF